MTAPILLDEPLETALVGELRGRGYRVAHVLEALGPGATDGEIADHARDRRAIVVTTDREFADVRFSDVRVFLLSSAAVPLSALADEIDAVRSAVEDVSELPRVTWLSVE